MKKYIFLCFAVFAMFGVNAQKITVLDKSDLQPINNVTITNPTKTQVVITNGAGVADLAGFAASDSLIFDHVAYQSYKVLKSNLSGEKVYLTENIIKLDEFVYIANREEEKKSDIPYKIEIINAKEVAFQNPQNAAVMLEQSGDVFVQTSQMGGGSPVLRGFEANKVLLVMDGVRMNTAIYRAGHLQSAITVDPYALSSTEVLYGPGSTLFGSDALGGVISFRTKDPMLSGGKFKVNGSAMVRYSSANNEKTGGINLNLGWKKLGVLLNFSYSDFDDLRMGRVRNPAYGSFGDRTYYAERINGQDSMMYNDKPWIQKTSGYSQYNFLGKILFQATEHSKYTVNVQYSNSSDIPRYDRLTEMTGSTLTYAEWYYGPQQRVFASLKGEYDKKTAIYNKATFIVAYQNNHEDRIQRNFGKSTKKFNLETVNVYSLNGDLEKRLAANDHLNYGIEVDYNDVTSEAYTQNIKTGETFYNRASRYPDEKANMMYLSAYLSNKWDINKVLSFSQGLRYSYVTLNAAYSDTMASIMNIPFDPNISQKNGALSGYVGLVATPGHDWKFSVVGSTGFRAPNVDDLTKLNVVNAQTIVVPNPDLEPEYAYNLEVGIAKTILEKVRIEATGFYTWMRNAQVINPFPYNGQDSITIDGEKYQTNAPTNTGKAHLTGVQANLLAQVTRAFSIASNLTYTYGFDDSGNEPLDHIPPMYGMTSFRLEVKRFKGDFYVMYNGWKRLSQYSPSGEDNENYATPYGMPSWYMLNLKLSYQVSKAFNVELGMENILDENYRKFASGISAPGRNLIVAVRGTL